MKNLTDQVHSMGMYALSIPMYKHASSSDGTFPRSAGIYSDSGWFTCQMYPGSYMHEAQDIQTFQDWGFDLLKYDNCAGMRHLLVDRLA